MGNSCSSAATEHRDLRTTTIINERWRVKKRIGHGGFGSVYTVVDLSVKEGPQVERAMKTENIRTPGDPGRLPQEVAVINAMRSKGRGRRLCELFDKGRIEQVGKKPLQFIVMTLLGPSIQEMRRMCPKCRMLGSTVALIGLQCVEAIEDLHKTGYIHRDIKPGNFAFRLWPNQHNIVMIDFGMCRKYLDENGNLLPVRKSSIKFRGTFRYCASESHKGIEYSRHHDLWCLFNSLIEMRNGELPWERYDGNAAATFEVKNKIIPTEWLRNVEPQYLDVYEWLTSLHYDMNPDYGKLQTVFIDILTKEQMDRNSPFEWEQTSRTFAQFRTSVLERVFQIPQQPQQHETQLRSALPIESSAHNSAGMKRTRAR